MGKTGLKTEDFTDANHRSRSNQHGTIPEPPNTDYTIVTCTHPKQIPSTALSIPQHTKSAELVLTGIKIKLNRNRNVLTSNLQSYTSRVGLNFIGVYF